MVIPDYHLFDVVEMKRPHPCKARCKQFQITRVGADIKIMCLGCGNVIMIDRDKFNLRIKKVLRSEEKILQVEN